MTPAGEYLIDRATRLVRHAERSQYLIHAVLDLVDTGYYDPVADIYLVRLPGGTVRALQRALEPETEEATGETVP
jgi:hypothetical protein